MVKNRIQVVKELSLLPEKAYPYSMNLSTKGRFNRKENTFRASKISIGFEDSFGLRFLHIKISGKKDNKNVYEVLMISAEDKITPTMKMIRFISGVKRIELRLGTNQLNSILTAIEKITEIVIEHNKKHAY